jgi:hypothetical protein
MGLYCKQGDLSNVPRFVVSQIDFGMGQAGMSHQQKHPRLGRLTRIKKNHSNTTVVYSIVISTTLFRLIGHHWFDQEYKSTGIHSCCV